MEHGWFAHGNPAAGPGALWYPRPHVSAINPLAREISAKIVYYGPGLSGKTTSLKYIHSVVRPERRGEMISLATETDRTIFFDFLPLHVERVRSMAVRLQLYTVPGQVFYAATRKLVLSGADGVVFVADSQEAARDANLESLEGLRENLTELGFDVDKFPTVFQYNKRDLPDVVPVSELSAALNWSKAPEFASSATRGPGVLSALKEVSRLVIRRLWEQQPTQYTRNVLVEERLEPEGGIVEQVASITRGEISVAAPPQHTQEVQHKTLQPPRPVSLSFAALWPNSDSAVVTVEDAIANGQSAQAVRHAARALATLLDALPGPDTEDGPIAKALLLGIDGREYLRLSRLATNPEESVSHEDALFALYLLIAAQIKQSRI